MITRTHHNYFTDQDQNSTMSKFQQFISNITAANSAKISPVESLANNNSINLSGLDPKTIKRVLDWQERAISQVRNDVKAWKNGWGMTTAEDDPKNFALQLMYEIDVMNDLMVTSQVENRLNECLGTEFSIKSRKGKTRDEAQTEVVAQSIGIRELITKVWESYLFGYSLVQQHVEVKDGGVMQLVTEDVPRTNVVPKKGRFYRDYTEDKYINYRELPEYGSYLLEFDTKKIGLLNKMVPILLFKKFALSNWSELCEIYGIPPRVIKTDTQNPKMLQRAQRMMADTGSAAWYIIDESEKMEWAQAVTTNGEVFQNILRFLNNEVSMVLSGAIIGQDTQNGNRSKDESAQEMLSKLVKSDLKRIEMTMNTIVIPALVKIGFLKGDILFEFDPTEDLDTLWTRTKDSFSEFDVDPEWVKNKFGIQITGKKQPNQPPTQNPKTNLSLGFLEGFFD